MVTIVDYWATWCGPCKMMEPIIEELEKELGDKLKVEKIDVDQDPARAQENGVFSIPTYVFMKDDKEVDRVIGFTPKKTMLEKITPLLA